MADVFVDQIKVHARAGKGGDGSIHFHRGKFRPKGGPDGGDGGWGGDVVLLVDPSTDSLRSFFFKSRLLAQDGAPGVGNECTGRSGDDVTFKVPPGTVVSRLTEAEDPDTGEIETKAEIVADLTETGSTFVLCKGGKGGKGNVHFKTATHRAPTEFTPGIKGEEGMFYFELRQIADAGLVGFPNAGKSSLLGKLSAAKPKVAPYRFTTLHPMVGVIEYEGYQRVTVADIPGLIEGAHENVGLGFEFLRHIQRCHLLLFVVDMAGTEVRDPCEDVATLRQEISLYDPVLAKRPWLVIANKMDLPESAENLKNFKQRFPKVKILPISAETGQGLEAVRKELYQRVLLAKQ